MKVTKRDDSRERTVLSAMITETAFLRRIVTGWDGQNFPSPYANIVGDWCVDHYKKYQEAPRVEETVTACYDAWAEKAHSKELALTIDKYLTALSDEHESPAHLNVDYLLDLARTVFNKAKSERLSKDINKANETGNIDKVKALVPGFGWTELGEAAGVDYFTDMEAIGLSYTERKVRRLIDYGKHSEALGHFFGDTFERDGFVVFTGPQKSTKSFWLQDVAYQAMRQRCRVVYFQVGDMSRHQLEDRFKVKRTKRPIRSSNSDGSWPCSIQIPISIKRDKGAPTQAKITGWKTKTFDHPVTKEEDFAECEKLMKTVTKSKRSFFKMYCYSVLGVTALGIQSVIDSLVVQGWPPDVVVIDYADNIAPVDPKEEKRHQINTTWSYLRKASQDLHCLIVTATQTNIKAYDKDWIDRTNFSEDNRKWNHITAAIGINSLPNEKTQQISRLNCFYKREGEANSRRGPSCAGCLALGNPAVLTTW